MARSIKKGPFVDAHLAKKVAKELASRANNTSFCTKATKTILANAVALHRKKAATNDSAILFC